MQARNGARFGVKRDCTRLEFEVENLVRVNSKLPREELLMFAENLKETELLFQSQMGQL